MRQSGRSSLSVNAGRGRRAAPHIRRQCNYKGLAGAGRNRLRVVGFQNGANGNDFECVYANDDLGAATLPADSNPRGTKNQKTRGTGAPRPEKKIENIENFLFLGPF